MVGRVSDDVGGDSEPASSVGSKVRRRNKKTGLNTVRLTELSPSKAARSAAGPGG